MHQKKNKDFSLQKKGSFKIRCFKNNKGVCLQKKHLSLCLRMTVLLTEEFCFQCKEKREEEKATCNACRHKSYTQLCFLSQDCTSTAKRRERKKKGHVMPAMTSRTHSYASCHKTVIFTSKHGGLTQSLLTQHIFPKQYE